MTLDAWYEAARADALRRNDDELARSIDSLAASTRTLRAADWNATAGGDARAAGAVPAPAAGGPWAASSSARMPGHAPVPISPAGSPSSELQYVVSLADQVRMGTLSSATLVETCLERIETLNPSLNAMIATFADDARVAARQADDDRAAGRLQGPLHGLPLTLKDLIDVAGTPTTAASRVRAGHVAASNAAVTDRLRRAGAIIIGKTNLHEFAFGTTNEDSAYGLVRHPVDPTRSPGGSSGGSAVAIRAGMCVASIGTDTGGSIRIPAAACGLVGLKPTLGEVPAQGVVPLSSTLDHVGPLARSVADARLLWQVLTGEGAVSLRLPRLNGLRLAVVEPYFCDLLEEGVRREFTLAIDRLTAAGAQVRRAAIPHAALTAPVYLHIVLAEAAAFHGPTLEERPQDYTRPVGVRLEMARHVLGEDYVRAMHGREVLTREVDSLLTTCDALLTPTLPIAAPRLGEAMVLLDGHREPTRNATLRLTQLFDVTGHPAITIPVGDAEPGLPAGLQIVGRRHQTASLLDAAEACERALADGAARIA